MADPEFQLKRPTFQIRVYEKYVEITDRSGLFGFLFPRTVSIPSRNIASVDVSRLTETLVIKTNDGKQHKFNVGGLGGSAKSVQEAILKML